jgi:allantoicase
VEIDTAYRLGDAAGRASLEAHCGGTRSELLPRTRSPPAPCTPLPAVHPVRVNGVRLNIYPDGGIARLWLHGSLIPAGLADLTGRLRAEVPYSVRSAVAV